MPYGFTEWTSSTLLSFPPPGGIDDDDGDDDDDRMRANRDTTRATPLGGGLGGHGESADVAPGELRHLPGGNNAVDVNLK